MKETIEQIIEAFERKYGCDVELQQTFTLIRNRANEMEREIEFLKKQKNIE